MRKTRQIEKRWIITGVLELVTPTHLSNGDSDPGVDMPLVTDPLEGRALLTGASLTGALRHYLNSYMDGYEQKKNRKGELVLVEKKDSAGVLLFGGSRGDDAGNQSALIVDDALGDSLILQVELRDGVRIEPTTRTAAEEAKYDTQLLAAGATFSIGMELLITEDTNAPGVLENLAIALRGLQNGEIPLGGRKRRGYGECRVTQWNVWDYDLLTPAGLKGWLTHDQSWEGSPVPTESGADIVPLLLGENASLPPDQRRQLRVTAQFGIDGSILIRAGFEAAAGPDMMHLESRPRRKPGRQKDEETVPILSGTTLAGVIRSQVQRIVHTVSGDPLKAETFTRNLFGYMPYRPDEDKEKGKQVSKISVSETEIEGNYTRLVHTRVAIDRFTGGALESALFAEQPIFGGQAFLKLTVSNPTDAEIGVLLLVLKDLWTGFLPIGGEASVGRGRLKGCKATISYPGQTWRFKANGHALEFLEGKPEELNAFVETFRKEVAA